MTDANKIELARAIHGTDLATRTSFSPVQWAGVERAWAWVVETFDIDTREPMTLEETIARVRTCTGMDGAARGVPDAPMTATARQYTVDLSKQKLVHLDACVLCGGAPGVPQRTCPASIHQPKEPTVKQATCTTCGATDPDAQGFCSNGFHAPPPWTEAQREAAERMRGIGWMQERDDCYEEMCEEMARSAHLFVKVPSVEECERAYNDAWHSDVGLDPKTSTFQELGKPERAGIAAVRALFVQVDGASALGGAPSGPSGDRCHASAKTDAAAPSPAPAGVPDRDALANAMQLALAKSPNDVVAPLRECRLDVVDLRYRQADAALEMFAPALRTRDERIAEMERELRVASEFAPNGDRRTCAACNAKLPDTTPEPFGMCAACVEKTWEVKDPQPPYSRIPCLGEGEGSPLSWAHRSDVEVCLRDRDDRIEKLESDWNAAQCSYEEERDLHIETKIERDTLKATIATLTKERDEARDELRQMTERADALNDKLNEHHPDMGWTARDERILQEFKAMRSDRDAALARVAELEKRGLTELAGQPIENFLQAKTIAEKRTGVRCDILESVKRMDGTLTAQKLKIQELEKRGAVDVDPPRVETGAVQFDDDWAGVFIRGDNALNYKQSVERAIRVLDGSKLFDAPLVKGQLIGLAKLLASCDAGANGTKPTKIDRKHSRDVRRITKQELDRVCTAIRETAMFETRDRIIAGFRAIGFEVEA